MAASRAVLGRKLCRRYQVFFYVALILVVFQIVLFFSFCSINLSPTPNNQIARLDFAQSQKLRRGLANSESKAAAQLDEHDAEENWRAHFGRVAACNVSSKEALSAIARAKTAECQQTIRDVVCLERANQLYPTNLPRFCPLKGNNTGEYIGCFKDDKQARIFPGLATNLQQTNTPMKCVNLCLLTGFQLAGVQYGYECWCGMSHGDAYRLAETNCDTPCVGDTTLKCGGFSVMNIYHTGLGGNPSPPTAPSTRRHDSEDKVRIVFVLTLNGRAVRQVRRLLKAIYHRDHYYYIHIDARQEYLYRELTSLGQRFDNIRLATHRFASIWGGASLLTMLLQCMTDLLSIKHWKWNFFLNLSESDFPIKPLDDLVNYLTENRNKNFVKSHGNNAGTGRFIRKQGLGKLFVECDNHMWRVGDRQLPAGIVVDGGSDWVSLNRDFCNYLTTSNDMLLSGLKEYWKYSLLPAESFFHTVLYNSAHCMTMVNNNLHLTNWRRHQGCNCQYKHIVDWCGCSPNDFLPHDMEKIKRTHDRPIFFARKFEAIVNQEVISEVEKYISGDDDKYVAGMNSYWQNEFHHEDTHTPCDDAYLTLYHSFVRLSLARLTRSSYACDLIPTKLLHAHVYNHLDSFQGFLVGFEVRNRAGGTLHELEAFLQPRSGYRVVRPVQLIKRLKSIEVGTKFDQKEELFRNVGGLIGPYADVVLRHSWGAGHEGKVTIVYVDPALVVAGSYDVTVAESEHVTHNQPTFNKPLRPGLWMVKLVLDNEVVAETDFLVTPLSHFNGQPISDSQALSAHRGPVAMYGDEDFKHLHQQLNFINKKLALRTAKLNEAKTGTRLLAWIDGLASKMWTHVETCYHGDAVPSSCAEVTQCTSAYWSSRYPDLKSEISGVDENTGKLLS